VATLKYTTAAVVEERLLGDSLRKTGNGLTVDFAFYVGIHRWIP